MDVMGPNGLFLHLSVAGGLLALFALYRTTQRAAVDTDEMADFVPVASTTAVAFELDPRSDTEDEAADHDKSAEAVQQADRP